MKYNRLYYILIFFLVSNSFAVTNSEINHAIKKFLIKNNIKQSFSINKKIKLPNCEKKLKVRKKFDSFKTLEIICKQDNPWKYNIRTKILDNEKKRVKKNRTKKLQTTLIKLNKNIKKNQAITKNDIYYEKTTKVGASNYISDINQVLGKKTKISLREGQILRDRHIKKNWMITEGQKIIIENNKSNIQILIDGIALHSAMQGDYIQVLNKSTGKSIKAWVKNNKKVSIFR